MTLCAFVSVFQNHPSDVDLSTEVATRLHLLDRETPAVATQPERDWPPAHGSLARHSDANDDLPRLTKVGAPTNIAVSKLPRIPSSLIIII